VTVLRTVLLSCFVLGLGFSITLSQASLALLALLWLWRLRRGEDRRAAAWPLAAPIVAFTLVTLASALASGHPRSSLLASKGVLLALALYVVADALPGAEAADRFLSALAVVGAGAALMGLVQVGLCPHPEPSDGLARWFFHRCDRARASFSIYMTLAGVLTLILLATVPRLLPGSLRRWSVAAWLVTLAGLAATFTRGAWVGFASGVLALLPATRRGRWLLVGGLLVLVMAALLGPAHLRQRLVSMSDPHDPTVRERQYMWRSGVTIWWEHPWLGIGPGGVKREYRRYAMPEAIKTRTGHLHNTPLQILVERGVIGLGAWLWIWVAFYAHALALLRRLPADARRERALVVGSAAAMTGFLVAGLSEYNFGDSEVALVAWSVMALPFAVARERPPPPPEPAAQGGLGARRRKAT
jgi:O-antigen ligase